MGAKGSVFSRGSFSNSEYSQMVSWGLKVWSMRNRYWAVVPTFVGLKANLSPPKFGVGTNFVTSPDATLLKSFEGMTLVENKVLYKVPAAHGDPLETGQGEALSPNNGIADDLPFDPRQVVVQALKSPDSSAAVGTVG